jgi:hypothetical protein
VIAVEYRLSAHTFACHCTKHALVFRALSACWNSAVLVDSAAGFWDLRDRFCRLGLTNAHGACASIAQNHICTPSPPFTKCVTGSHVNCSAISTEHAVARSRGAVPYKACSFSALRCDIALGADDSADGHGSHLDWCWICVSEYKFCVRLLIAILHTFALCLAVRSSHAC